MWVLRRVHLHLPSVTQPARSSTWAKGPDPARLIRASGSNTASLLLTIPQCGSTALKNPCCQNCFAASLCSLGHLQLHQAHANIVASSINCLKNMLVVRHYTLSRCCMLASLKLSDIKLCNVNSEEILQTHQEYRAKLSPISSVLSSCPFFPVCKALCSFLCCVVDRNIWLFAIKAAMGVSVELVLNVSIAQVQLWERRPIFSLTHTGLKSEQLF